MDNKTIKEVVLNTIKEKTEIIIEEKDLDNALIKNDNINSLQMFFIISEIENKLSIRLNNEDLLKINTIRDLINIINTYC